MFFANWNKSKKLLSILFGVLCATLSRNHGVVSVAFTFASSNKKWKFNINFMFSASRDSFLWQIKLLSKFCLSKQRNKIIFFFIFLQHQQKLIELILLSSQILSRDIRGCTFALVNAKIGRFWLEHLEDDIRSNRVSPPPPPHSEQNWNITQKALPYYTSSWSPTHNNTTTLWAPLLKFSCTSLCL